MTATDTSNQQPSPVARRRLSRTSCISIALIALFSTTSMVLQQAQAAPAAAPAAKAAIVEAGTTPRKCAMRGRYSRAGTTARPVKATTGARCPGTRPATARGRYSP